VPQPALTWLVVTRLVLTLHTQSLAEHQIWRKSEPRVGAWLE